MDSADKTMVTEPFYKKPFKNRKTRIVIISLAILIVGGYIFIHFFLTPLVKKKIIASVYKSSGGLYSLQMDDFELRFWKGAVYMGKVQLKQDTILLNKLRQEDPSANLSNIDIKINEIIISRIWWQNFLLNHSLKVGKVEINQPEFAFHAKAPTDTLKVGKKSFLDLLPGIVASFAGSLKIEELKIDQGKLQYHVKGETGMTRQHADSIFLEMKEIEIDTISPNKALYTDHVRFSLSNYELITSDQLFKLNLKKISGSYADSSLSIESISFAPADTTKKAEGGDHYKCYIKSITNKGINFSRFFKENKVSLGAMKVQSPDIDVTYRMVTPDKNDSAAGRSANQNFLQTILPYIAYSFTMDKFSIEDGRINTNVISQEGSVRQKADNIFLDLEDIKVDTITLKNGNYWHNLKLSLTGFESRLAPQNLKVNIESLSAASSDASMHATGLVIAQLHPSEKGEQFIYKNYTQRLDATGIDYHRLLYADGVGIETIDVTGMNLEITNDERLKLPVAHGVMPHEMMKAIPTYLRIDRVNFNNAYIKYINYAPDVKEPGILTFEKANLTLTNITNDPKLMSVKNPARIKGQMLVMGKGLLKLDIKVPLLTKDFNCTYKGSLGPIEATNFNSFLEYGGMRLESGSIEAQSFEVNVVNGKADGNMVLLYHNLNAKIVNKKTGKVKKFFSKIANFVLKNDNKQEENKGPVNATIDYARKPEDGFLSYVWSSISDGIMKTVVKDFFEPVVK